MLSKALIVTLAALCLCGVAAAASYCKVCSDHTMCKYSASDIGSACVDYCTTTLTTSDINKLVHAHNRLRNRVARGLEKGSGGNNAQPSASNMRKMIWSSELAKIAQRWANQCNFNHDTCRSAADGTYVGQNIYWEASSGALASPNWTKPIQEWYNEVFDRTPGTLNTKPFAPTSGAVVGHYTQLVWADSYKLGCGYSQYKEGSWYARLIVCNYGPGGNVVGDYMYKAGAPASKCPSGTAKDSYYTGLCSSKSSTTSTSG